MGAGRIAVQIDSVAAKAFDSQDSLPEEGYGFFRIVSTQAALQRMMEEDEPLAVGDWVQLFASPDEHIVGPRIWSLQLRENRFAGVEPTGRPGKGKLTRLRRLSRASRPIDPRPLGSAVTTQIVLGSALKTRYSLSTLDDPVPPGAINYFLRHWSRAWGTSEVIAYDVGQASFNVISPLLKGAPTLYFDVGQPIWFHIHNAPADFSPPSPKGGFVVLSHWDTDHYAYGRQNHSFHERLWFAPAQTAVGPNAYRFAKQLYDKGHLILVGKGKSSRHRRGVRIIRCVGHSINGSGLALHLRTNGRDILLTGDADYHEIPSLKGTHLTGLQLPHHGGRMSSFAKVPQAHSGPARAVISCGFPNRYRHPNPTTITDHQLAGWKLEITAAIGGKARGPRLL